LPLLRAWRTHERRVIPGRASLVIPIEQGYWRPPIRVINDYLALARKESQLTTADIIAIVGMLTIYGFYFISSNTSCTCRHARSDWSSGNPIMSPFRPGPCSLSMPVRYAPNTTAYNCFNRSSRRGIWKRVFSWRQNRAAVCI
jgi:hypothetical protein